MLKKLLKFTFFMLQQSIMREKGVARKLVDRSSETMEVTDEQKLEYQRNLDRLVLRTRAHAKYRDFFHM